LGEKYETGKRKTGNMLKEKGERGKKKKRRERKRETGR
jgi:hypothetical protein